MTEMVKRYSNGDIVLLKVEDMARILDVHTVTIRRYVGCGKIKGSKIGKRWYVFKENFLDFINEKMEKKAEMGEVD